MWRVMVVVVMPSRKFLPGIVQRDELVDVQELVAHPSDEGLDQAMIRGLSQAGVVELASSAVRPFIQRLRGELRPIIHRDRFRPATVPGDLIPRLGNAAAREPEHPARRTSSSTYGRGLPDTHLADTSTTGGVAAHKRSGLR